MNLKRYLVVGLISFLFGVIVGYSFHGYPTFESILKWIIGGLSFAIVVPMTLEGVKMFFDTYKAKQAKLKHHSKNELYPAIQTLTDNLEIGLFISSHIPDKKYSNEVYKHITDGYPDGADKLMKERNYAINRFNSMVHSFIETIIKEIETKTKQKIPYLVEWNGVGQPPLKHFNTKIISEDAGDVIKKSYRQQFEVEEFWHIKSENGRWKLYSKPEYLFCWNDVPGKDNDRLMEFLKKRFGVDWVEKASVKSDDSNTINLTFKDNSLILKHNKEETKITLQIDDGRTDEFIMKLENGRLNIYNPSIVESDFDSDVKDAKHVIEMVLTNALMGEDFKKIVEYYRDVKYKHELFVSAINEILKYIDNDIYLKGKCEICKRF